LMLALGTAVKETSKARQFAERKALD